MNKDPDAVLDYGHDWSGWLIDGDTITTSVWIVPDGITKDSDSHDTTSTTIWLSGGELGKRYILVNRVTTTGGRTDDRSMQIDIKDR